MAATKDMSVKNGCHGLNPDGDGDRSVESRDLSCRADTTVLTLYFHPTITLNIQEMNIYIYIYICICIYMNIV